MHDRLQKPLGTGTSHCNILIPHFSQSGSKRELTDLKIFFFSLGIKLNVMQAELISI